MVDARYRNKKNGRTAVVMQEDHKYKTVLLQYEDDESEQQVSSSTLKRWWEEIDDDDEEFEEEVEDDEEDYDDEEDDEDLDDDEDDEDEGEEEADEEDDVEEDEDEESDEDVAGDGTPLKEVGKEIAKQAKEKAAKAKKEKKSAPKKNVSKIDKTPYIKDVRAISKQLGFGWKEYENVKNFAVLTISDHIKAGVRFKNDGLSFNVKEDFAKANKYKYTTMKYFLPAVICLEYSASFKNDVKSLLTLIQKSSSDVKEKKASKKK